MFCIKYYPFEKYVEDAEELKIVYRPADRTLEEFLQKFNDKSIVIDVTGTFDDLDAELLKELSIKYNNIKLIIDFNNKESLEKVLEKEIPFFFCNFVTTVDQLWGLMKYHPTDMYICEELGFSLDKISKILHGNGIKVRVLPNICQSSFAETESLKTFFIRPEDIDIYSAFVDVFELVSDQERQKVILKIYKQKKWMGPIKEIIPSFKNDLDGRYLISSFGAVRSKCGKRCMYRPESCSICDRFVELSEALKERNLIVKRIKKKN